MSTMSSSHVVTKKGVIKKAFMTSLIVGTILTVINQWSALFNDASVHWFPLFLTYVVPFFVYWLGTQHGAGGAIDAVDDVSNVQVAPEHIEALYQQAMIVVKNAHKANAAFAVQLKNIHSLREKARLLQEGDDFQSIHDDLVAELGMLESRIEKILKEMGKNVRLGEKLQQSVANIDPAIGIDD